MKRSRCRGLSTIELLTTILGMVVISLLFVKGVVNRSTADQRTTTILRMQAIEKALRDYAIDNGGLFPTTKQGLRALLKCPTTGPIPPNWRGPYLDSAEGQQAILDAWGQPFHYVAPGNGNPPRCYDLWSNGADKCEGGEGADADICSWDRNTQLP